MGKPECDLAIWVQQSRESEDPDSVPSRRSASPTWSVDGAEDLGAALGAMPRGLGWAASSLLIFWVDEPVTTVVVSAREALVLSRLTQQLRVVIHWSDDLDPNERADAEVVESALVATPVECVELYGVRFDEFLAEPGRDLPSVLAQVIADCDQEQTTRLTAHLHARARGNELIFSSSQLEKLGRNGIDLVLVAHFRGPSMVDYAGRWSVATAVPHACLDLVVELEDGEGVTFDSIAQSFVDESLTVLSTCPYCRAPLRDADGKVATFAPTIPESA